MRRCLPVCARARVVYSDNGRTHLHCHIHDLADFLRHCFRQRTAVYCEVLCEDVDQAAVYRSASGNDTVAEILLLFHSEVGATVQLEHVKFLEAAFVEKHVYTFARCVLSTCVLFLYGFSPPPRRAFSRFAISSLIFLLVCSLVFVFLQRLMLEILAVCGKIRRRQGLSYNLIYIIIVRKAL